MFAAAPMSTACADLGACLAYQMRRALAVANLRHDAPAGAAGWQMMRAAERVNINRQWQRRALRGRAVGADGEGVAVQRAKNRDRF